VGCNDPEKIEAAVAMLCEIGVWESVCDARDIPFQLREEVMARYLSRELNA
jgi:hypothetical protein